MSKNPDHVDTLVSLKRIEGQVRGLQNMVEDRKYCVDIITQIQSVKGALSRVERDILKKHIENCVVKTMKGRSTAQKNEKIDVGNAKFGFYVPHAMHPV